jgi:hypothetical protein
MTFIVPDYSVVATDRALSTRKTQRSSQAVGFRMIVLQLPARPHAQSEGPVRRFFQRSTGSLFENA